VFVWGEPEEVRTVNESVEDLAKHLQVMGLDHLRKPPKGTPRWQRERLLGIGIGLVIAFHEVSAWADIDINTDEWLDELSRR
jgi:hypothetical protein